MESMKCKICKNTYNQNERLPMILPCGHCFCKVCLEEEYNTNKKNICSIDQKESFIEFSNLNPNYTLLDLLENVPLDALHQQLENEKTQQKIIQNKDFPLVCSSHPFKQGEYLCYTHNEILCVNCAWKHSDHRRSVIDYSLDLLRIQSQATIDNLKSIQDTLQEQIKKLITLSQKQRVSADDYRKSKGELDEFLKKNINARAQRDLVQFGLNKFTQIQDQFKFKKELVGSCFQIINDTQVKFVGGNKVGDVRFCLMDLNIMEKLLDKYVWKATIITHGSWTAVGVAFKREISQGNFIFDYSGPTNSAPTKRKFYMISFNGYKWCYNSEEEHSKNVSFQFKQGDVITCCFDTQTNILKFDLNNQNQSSQFKIDVPEGTELVPAVCITGANDEIKLELQSDY